MTLRIRLGYKIYASKYPTNLFKKEATDSNATHSQSTIVCK